jgi:hypothetical protein
MKGEVLTAFCESALRSNLLSVPPCCVEATLTMTGATPIVER